MTHGNGHDDPRRQIGGLIRSILLGTDSTARVEPPPGAPSRRHVRADFSHRLKQTPIGAVRELTPMNLAAAIEELRPRDTCEALAPLFGVSMTTIRRRRLDWGLPMHTEAVSHSRYPEARRPTIQTTGEG